MGRLDKLIRRLAGPAPAREAPPAVSRDRLGHYPGPPATHPTRWEWPAYLDTRGSIWLASLRGLYEMPIAFPDSISPEAGLLVHALVRNIQPRTVVEVGAFVGVSAHWIAGALAEFAAAQAADLRTAPEVHVFDRFDPIGKGAWREAEMPAGRLEWIQKRLDAAGLSGFVRLHPGDSSATILSAAPELRARGGVQLAFIDGDHTPAGVLRDFRSVEPLLDTGGYILLHDTFPEQCAHAGPRRLLDTIHEAGAGRYQMMDLYSAPLNYGLGLLRRVG